MNLVHAMKVAKRLEGRLQGEEAAAVHVLLKVAHRVTRARVTLADLLKAVSEETALNQTSMFPGDDE